MPLTRADETDLILPLLSGLRENPRFSTFLERLRRRTGARYIALLIRRSEGASSPIETFHAQDGQAEPIPPADVPALFALERADYDSLRPGRVYAIGELIDHDPVLRVQRRRDMHARGLADERIVRVLAEPRLNVWLVLARTNACSASDSALLSSLSPYVAEAVRTASELDRERRDAQISATGLVHAGHGWATFDAEGRLTAIAPGTAKWWSEHKRHDPRPGERLLGLSRPTERALLENIRAVLEPTGRSPRPVLLSEAPPVEALLLPLPNAPTPSQSLEVLALLTLPHPPAHDAPERLRAIHALPRREAQLALKLAQGMPIAQAATEMGLTTETARNYSKRIYAKLGVRGKAELVRRVLEGTAGMT